MDQDQPRLGFHGWPMPIAREHHVNLWRVDRLPRYASYSRDHATMLGMLGEQRIVRLYILLPNPPIPMKINSTL